MIKRFLLPLCAAALVFTVFATVVHAQGDDGAGGAGGGGAVVRQAAAAAQTPGVSTPPTDVDVSGSSSMSLLFWIFAIASVAGSIFVITRRNLIAAVMGMVATFFGLAVLYMMLFAGFLAVIQMLVYAGAVMVLFVFVIMVLNKPEDEPWGVVGLPGKVLAGLAMLYLLVRIVFLVWSVTPPNPQAAMAPPPPVQVSWKEPSSGEGDPRPRDQNGMVTTTESYDFGSTAAVGDNLFGDYVFPFEAISILLLIAVVGAIAIARPLHETDEADNAEVP